MNLVDVLIPVALLAGLVRGRQHGISIELIRTLKWIALVMAGAAFALPGGQALARYGFFDFESACLMIYLGVALVRSLRGRARSRAPRHFCRAIAAYVRRNWDARCRLDFSFSSLSGCAGRCRARSSLHGSLLTPRNRGLASAPQLRGKISSVPEKRF